MDKATSLNYEELVKGYQHSADMVQIYAELVGITFDGAYHDQDGMNYGTDVYAALRNVLAKHYETARWRQKIWDSDLSREAQIQLVTLLNLVEQFIHYLIMDEDKVQLMDTGDRIIDHIHWFVPPSS